MCRCRVTVFMFFPWHSRIWIVANLGGWAMCWRCTWAGLGQTSSKRDEDLKKDTHLPDYKTCPAHTVAGAIEGQRAKLSLQAISSETYQHINPVHGLYNPMNSFDKHKYFMFLCQTIVMKSPLNVWADLYSPKWK